MCTCESVKFTCLIWSSNHTFTSTLWFWIRSSEPNNKKDLKPVEWFFGGDNHLPSKSKTLFQMCGSKLWSHFKKSHKYDRYQQSLINVQFTLKKNNGLITISEMIQATKNLI
jgi:hypothetical protein